jgi:hypothetical protein
MDEKIPSSVGDLEVADQTGSSTLNTYGGRNMTRDEGEMAYFGKKAQLKVCILDGLATAGS